MSGDLLDRLERELIDGMRRYEAHPRRSALRRYAPRHSRSVTLAIVATTLVVIALVLLPVVPTRLDEEPTPSAATAPPAPPHIANRNWKPVSPSAQGLVFQLTLTATSWTVIPDPQLDGRHGHLRWSGHRMIVNADAPCDASGVYHVGLAKNLMTITAEHDPCAQRRSVLERKWFGLP